MHVHDFNRSWPFALPLSPFSLLLPFFTPSPPFLSFCVSVTRELLLEWLPGAQAESWFSEAWTLVSEWCGPDGVHVSSINHSLYKSSRRDDTPRALPSCHGWCCSAQSGTDLGHLITAAEISRWPQPCCAPKLTLHNVPPSLSLLLALNILSALLTFSRGVFIFRDQWFFWLTVFT